VVRESVRGGEAHRCRPRPRHVLQPMMNPNLPSFISGPLETAITLSFEPCVYHLLLILSSSTLTHYFSNAFPITHADRFGSIKKYVLNDTNRKVIQNISCVLPIVVSLRGIDSSPNRHLYSRY
jgi:hypothetical protein